MHAQAKQNNTLTKLTENHSTMLGNLSNQTVSLKNDVQVLQERTKTVEAQLGKIAESQTIILARFAGKPEFLLSMSHPFTPLLDVIVVLG